LALRELQGALAARASGSATVACPVRARVGLWLLPKTVISRAGLDSFFISGYSAEGLCARPTRISADEM